MLHHTPDALRIDVGAASSREALHRLLATAFHFPDYYGHNWDVFEECIRDVELPARIELVGFETLCTRLPRKAELLQRCVGDFVPESHYDLTMRKA